MAPTPIDGNRYATARDALKDKINTAIDGIRANGEYKKIQDKYFNFDIYGPDAQ